MPKFEIIQPNRVTMARYDYSKYEKRIMYRIIALIQSQMRGEIELDVSTFGDQYFVIPIENVDPEKKNHRLIRNALQSLQDKKISIDYDEFGDGFEGRMINWGELKAGQLIISVPHAIGKPLLEIAKGFTAYSIVVVMALKSSYSMRFYEWCSRFKDTGIWFTSPDKLREMLGIEDMKGYTTYARLKDKIIDVAQKELQILYQNGESDIYFTYKEKRSGKGRGGQVKELIFTIYWTKKATINEIKPDDYYVVSNFLLAYFNADTRDIKLYKETVLRRILENNFAEKAAKIIEIAKTKNSPAAYFRTALEQETGINSKTPKYSKEEYQNEKVKNYYSEKRGKKMETEGRSGEISLKDLIPPPLQNSEEIYKKALQKKYKKDE